HASISSFVVTQYQTTRYAITSESCEKAVRAAARIVPRPFDLPGCNTFDSQFFQLFPHDIHTGPAGYPLSDVENRGDVLVEQLVERARRVGGQAGMDGCGLDDVGAGRAEPVEPLGCGRERDGTGGVIAATD